MHPCACGCGKDARQRFAKGHRLAAAFAYVEQDRGYETPCWAWLGSKSPNGYGLHTEAGRRTTAHRISYERVHGRLAPEVHLDHLCRQRDCVNPAHLEPVSCAVNIRRGDSTSLTPEAVAAIRAATGTQREIARAFDVSQPTVSRVRSGRVWGLPAGPLTPA